MHILQGLFDENSLGKTPTKDHIFSLRILSLVSMEKGEKLGTPFLHFSSIFSCQ